MSGSDFGRQIGETIAGEVAKHQALPPRQKSLARAGMGAWLLTAGVYAAWWSKAFTGRSAGDLVAAFLRAPSSAWLPVAIWGGAMLLGSLWFVVGVANARGPRETMTIFWAIVRLGVVAALLWFQVYFPADWDWELGNVVLRGVYLAYLAMCLVDLALVLRPPSRGPAPTVPRGW